MSAPNEDSKAGQPYAVLGSGDLASHLHRRNIDGDNKEYRFNLFLTEMDGRVTYNLGPRDLRSIVKICQVLAFTIADDGWLPKELRAELFELADDLDYITHQWSNSDHGPQTRA